MHPGWKTTMRRQRLHNKRKRNKFAASQATARARMQDQNPARRMERRNPNDST